MAGTIPAELSAIEATKLRWMKDERKDPETRHGHEEEILSGLST